MKKTACASSRVKELAEEYIRLSQLPNISDIESERIADILTIAMSNNCLNRLICEADEMLSNGFKSFESGYLYSQRAELESCMDIIEGLLDEIKLTKCQ